MRLGLLQKKNQPTFKSYLSNVCFWLPSQVYYHRHDDKMRHCFCIRRRDESRGTTLRCNRNRPNMRDMCQDYGMAYNTGLVLPFCSPCLLELQPTYINCYSYKTQNPKIKQQQHPQKTHYYFSRLFLKLVHKLKL